MYDRIEKNQSAKKRLESDNTRAGPKNQKGILKKPKKKK